VCSSDLRKRRVLSSSHSARSASRQQPVARAEVAEEEPGEGEEEPVVPEEQDESQPKSALNALDINLGARFGTRDFVYNDPLPGLRKYGMSVSPNLRLALRWYPVAHFDDGALSNIGLDLRGEMLVGVTSKNRAGQKFDTSAHTLGVGLRGRIPFRTFEVGAVLGYGVQAFSLASTSKASPDVPNATYGFLRAGLDARWQFYDPLYFSVQAAYLFGLSHGQIEDKSWFPHTSGTESSSSSPWVARSRDCSRSKPGSEFSATSCRSIRCRMIPVCATKVASPAVRWINTCRAASRW